jgi:hypothetical protein
MGEGGDAWGLHQGGEHDVGDEVEGDDALGRFAGV